MFPNFKLFWQAACLLLLFLGVGSLPTLSAQQNASLEKGVFGYRNESYRIELQILSVSDTELKFRLTAENDAVACGSFIEGKAQKIEATEIDSAFFKQTFGKSLSETEKITVFAHQNEHCPFRFYWAETQNKIWIQNLNCKTDSNDCTFFPYSWLFLM
jgi:hypothetical protein